MSGIDYQALRAAVSMERVLALLGWESGQGRGRQLRGPCPVHDPDAAGGSRCFSVNLDRHAFRCFTCGAQGNQLDLWRLAHRLPLHAAALHLCHQAAIPPPLSPPASASKGEIRNEASSAPRPATH